MIYSIYDDIIRTLLHIYICIYMYIYIHTLHVISPFATGLTTIDPEIIGKLFLPHPLEPYGFSNNPKSIAKFCEKNRGQAQILVIRQHLAETN